jgi:aspartyl-tRNA synthetase
MPAQYTGGKLYEWPEDEPQPAHTHNAFTKTLEERIEDLERELREIREELP